MPSTKKILYAYVDESGQDTLGRIFVVSIVVLGPEREVLLKELETIEERSGKGNSKWHKSRHEFRSAYILALTNLTQLRYSSYCEIFRETREYRKLTAMATAKAILKRSQGAAYKATVFVDGLTHSDIIVFSKVLRALRIVTRKIRGVRKEENDALIRLADALCGLIRDAEENQEWAVAALQRLKSLGILAEV